MTIKELIAEIETCVRIGTLDIKDALAAVQRGQWQQGMEDIVACAMEDHSSDSTSFDDRPLMLQEQGGVWVQLWTWVENVYIEEGDDTDLAAQHQREQEALTGGED